MSVGFYLASCRDETRYEKYSFPARMLVWIDTNDLKILANDSRSHLYQKRPRQFEASCAGRYVFVSVDTLGTDSIKVRIPNKSGNWVP